MYVLVLHFLNSFANLLFPYVRQQHKSWHANFFKKLWYKYLPSHHFFLWRQVR